MVINLSVEQEIEKMLRIKTTGRDDSNSNLTNYPYEATSYEVLKELVSREYIGKDDVVIDFGCGKGRVDFFLAYYTKAKLVGIEYDLRLYNKAQDNLKLAKASNRIEFINCCASTYINNDVTCAYFFNPFSIHILKQVLENIKKHSHNDVTLFFYYPSFEYLSILDTTDFITFIEDIDCRSILKKDDKREIISVYKLTKEKS